MNKKKKKGFRIFILVLGAIIIFTIIVLLLCAYVFKLSARQVIVHNNEIIPDKSIIEISKIDNDSNFLLLNTNSIKKNIKEDKLIKKVKIKRNIFLEIHIYIEEYKPLFVREDTSKLVLNNEKEITNQNYYDLNVPNLVNYVPDKVYKKLIKKMDEADYNIIKKISEIKYYPNNYDEERFVLYMIDSNMVYINLPKFNSVNDYNKMVEKFEGKTGKLYLDSGNYFEYDKKDKETKENKDKKEENKSKKTSKTESKKKNN